MGLQVEDQPLLRGELYVALTAVSGVQLPTSMLGHLSLGAETRIADATSIVLGLLE